MSNPFGPIFEDRWVAGRKEPLPVRNYTAEHWRAVAYGVGAIALFFLATGIAAACTPTIREAEPKAPGTTYDQVVINRLDDGMTCYVYHPRYGGAPVMHCERSPR